jgi:hypothetical protein
VEGLFSRVTRLYIEETQNFWVKREQICKGIKQFWLNEIVWVEKMMNIIEM